jgi:hypothetical protein
MRDRESIQIEVEQFKMVTIPDAAPVETIDINKVEDVGVDKNENITEE